MDLKDFYQVMIDDDSQVSLNISSSADALCIK